MSLNFRSLCFLLYCVSYSSSFLFHVYADTMDMFLGYVRCKSYGMVDYICTNHSSFVPFPCVLVLRCTY